MAKAAAKHKGIYASHIRNEENRAVEAINEAITSFNGKNISEINKLMGRKAKVKFEAETIMDMVEKGGAQMVYNSMNEEDVNDMATFQKPHAYSKGFKYVIVNGQLVVENEKHLGTKSGKALYGQAYVK